MSADNLNDRLLKLGLTFPGGIAVLPLNFDVAETRDELNYSPLTVEIERELRKAGVQLEIADPDDDRVYLETRSVDWVLPVMAFGAVLVNNPEAVQVVLGVISNYLFDKMKRLGSNHTVRMEILRERLDGKDHLKYEGPVEGLKSLEAWAPAKGE